MGKLRLLDMKAGKFKKEENIFFIRIPPVPERPFTVRAHADDKINYTRIAYYFDQQSAQLISTETFSEKNTGDKIQALNYDIHVGAIGRYPTKILAFIACLVIASLPVTGFLLWKGRRYKTIRKKQRSPFLVIVIFMQKYCIGYYDRNKPNIVQM